MSYRNLFSQRLGQLRKEKGLSYAQLGEKLGVSDEAVRLMEKSKRSPSFEVLCSIAEVFDVPVDYLLGRGVFANWEKVLQYKEQICRKFSEEHPIVSQLGINLMELSDANFMKVMASMVEKMEFTEGDGQPNINIFLYPLFLMD